MDEDDFLLGAWGSAILGAFVGGFGGAIYAWMAAPVVGGEFWPYIRVGIVFVAGSVGLPLGAFMFFLAAIVTMFTAAYLR